jgi:hypothetical protein
VLESGVMLGWGSYLMRKAAGSDAHFIYISPTSPDVVSKSLKNRAYFIDDGPSTQLWNDKFIDFNKVDWDALGMSATDSENTLIYFDDHQSGYRRLLEAEKAGFKHVMYDDGYPFPSIFARKFAKLSK